jgi:hypothetical protein
MNGKIIPVSHSQLTSLDLDAFVRQAKALNQRNREHFTTPFPKRPSRWISHYQFEPRLITFPDKGAVEGGLSWLVGAALDFNCPCREARAVRPRPVCGLLWRQRGKLLRPSQPLVFGGGGQSRWLPRLCQLLSGPGAG